MDLFFNDSFYKFYGRKTIEKVHCPSCCFVVLLGPGLRTLFNSVKWCFCTVGFTIPC